MDPFSIVGAVGTAGSIIDLLTKAIILVDGWYQNYKDAPQEVEQLHQELHLAQQTIFMISTILSHSSQNASPALPEFQQPGFLMSLRGAQTTLQHVYSECSAIESRFKPNVSRRVVWALADSRRVGRLRKSLEMMQSSLCSFLSVHTFQIENLLLNFARSSVLLVIHENMQREAEQSRADTKALLDAVQGAQVGSPSEPHHQVVEVTPTNLQGVRREHKPQLLRKVLAVSVQWQQRYNCSFRLSGIAGANEPVSAYNFLLHLTFPTGLFGDKTLRVALSLGIGRPWYERIDILGGGIRTHNTVPYDSEAISAARTGNVTLLKMLLTHKRASIRDATPDVRPLLWHAIDGDSVEAVDYLLASKADAKALAGPYQTELLSRAFYHRNLAISRLLLQHGVDLDHINASGTTPVHHLFNPGRPAAAGSQFLEMIIANGFSNLNIQDEFGESALHRAASFGTAADIDLLVQHGADHRLRAPAGSKGWTPLFVAARSDNAETLRRLVEVARARERTGTEQVIGDVDASGWTPLHVAVDNDAFQAVRELLRMGADPFSLSVPAFEARFCDEVKGRRVSPIDLARHKGRDALERFERLMREEGRHMTYLDEEGDVFWPASTGEEEEKDDDCHGGCRPGCAGHAVLGDPSLS
ncbi:ankyrin repeat-containing domain protein [Echria macrotheca]|uniref:Ankyrin repeat-containing domain protein n=1 Tax=Echria macrotheca TaxID=438768 RepID=A0AAJ0B8D9_9PEZI|nr:ankyrin repeat-containing domain protein [Echria macrotheca]